MKHFFKLTCVAAALTAAIFIFSSFNKNEKKSTNMDAIAIQPASSTENRGIYDCSGNFTNLNPGNGFNDTSK